MLGSTKPPGLKQTYGGCDEWHAENHQHLKVVGHHLEENGLIKFEEIPLAPHVVVPERSNGAA